MQRPGTGFGDPQARAPSGIPRWSTAALEGLSEGASDGRVDSASPGAGTEQAQLTPAVCGAPRC